MATPSGRPRNRRNALRAQHRALGRRRIALATALAVALAIGLAVALGTNGATAGPHGTTSKNASRATSAIPKHALRLTVGAPLKVHPIRPGFLGLSIEYPAIEQYAGTDPSTVNPILVQLIRNLTPNQSPVLRIGGDSTDWEWWPVPNMRKPGGVRYTLTPTWIAVTRALIEQLNARLILGLDLEANSLSLAKAEANAFTNGLGRARVEALEPGNEPELYASFAWYRTADGRRVTGRAPDWNINTYEREVAGLRRALRPTPIAGPATGGPKWTSELPQFLAATPYLKLLTLHRYPLQLCYTPPSKPDYPTIAHLLSPLASRGLAAGIERYIRLAHAHGIPTRIDEMNTNSCGSAPRVTKTFASALWATDALFAMAGAGADGVNIHTYDGSSYELFTFDHTRNGWSARVEPEYYGLYLFALAAPPGSRLLRVSGPATNAVSAWATSAPDGHLRITLINDNQSHSRTVAIHAPGKSATATLLRMTAPGARSRGGVIIGGLTFGARTTTGRPAGTQRRYAVAPTNGEYVIKVPAASAALLIR